MRYRKKPVVIEAYQTDKELDIETPEAAFETVRQMLTAGHYVVMVSREEKLWIVNYIYSDTCSRNDTVFMSREDFEEDYCKYGE